VATEFLLCSKNLKVIHSTEIRQAAKVKVQIKLVKEFTIHPGLISLVCSVQTNDINPGWFFSSIKHRYIGKQLPRDLDF